MFEPNHQSIVVRPKCSPCGKKLEAEEVRAGHFVNIVSTRITFVPQLRFSVTTYHYRQPLVRWQSVVWTTTIRIISTEASISYSLQSPRNHRHHAEKTLSTVCYSDELPITTSTLKVHYVLNRHTSIASVMALALLKCALPHIFYIQERPLIFSTISFFIHNKPMHQSWNDASSSHSNPQTTLHWKNNNPPRTSRWFMS